jgi:hypothetical protein
METEPWEYLILTLRADTEEQHTFLQREYPEKKLPAYAPEALIPLLNHYGTQGWEMVTLHPVIQGSRGDMFMGGPAVDVKSYWTNQYLCTFKRRTSAPGQ